MRSLDLSEDGFTIVELLIAIVVGAIYMGSISALISNNAKLGQRTRDLAVVNSYAENKLESLRSAGYLSLSDGTTSVTSELPGELNTSRSGSLTITSQTSALKKAVLSVTFNDQGQSRTYSYTTYIGELGVGQQ